MESTLDIILDMAAFNPNSPISHFRKNFPFPIETPLEKQYESE
jgi:hypothetical protein